jgi:hypothetical protein
MRTQMGLQRTLLASARTAVSLIGFGFTVAQFFQKLVSSVPEDVRRLGAEAPRFPRIVSRLGPCQGPVRSWPFQFLPWRG